MKITREFFHDLVLREYWRDMMIYSGLDQLVIGY